MGIIFIAVLMVTVIPGALVGGLIGLSVGLVKRKTWDIYAMFGMLTGAVCGLVVGGIIITNMLHQVTWVGH